MSVYEISKSSILSLKAEILRKQEEIKNKCGTEQSNKLIKKKITQEIKNKDVDKRKEKDTAEDNEILKQSRAALERKAKLYEKLSKSKINIDDPAHPINRFLVRFKDKDDNFQDEMPDLPIEEVDDTEEYVDESVNPEDEWVEYVDSLGRTRTCLRKDLTYFKSKEKDYHRSPSREKDIEKTEDKIIAPEKDEVVKELLSDDMRREMLRKQWEKEEEELMDKDNIHYQDILFNEARVHGVGYYGFSKDEEERKKQQEALKKLRQDTLNEQKRNQEIKLTREKQLAARLKAAKNRKRARLGLPPLEDEEEEVIGPVPPTENITEEKTEGEVVKEKLLEEARRNHIRPWDIGKDFKKEHYEYSQEEWVEKQRKERKDEFAPPSTYRNFRSDVPSTSFSNEKKSLNFTTKKDSSDVKTNASVNPYKRNNLNDLEDPYNEETGKFMEYTGSFNLSHESSTVSEQKQNSSAPEKIANKKAKINPKIEASVEAGLQFLRKQLDKVSNVKDTNNVDMFTL